MHLLSSVDALYYAIKHEYQERQSSMLIVDVENCVNNTEKEEHQKRGKPDQLEEGNTTGILVIEQCQLVAVFNVKS